MLLVLAFVVGGASFAALDFKSSYFSAQMLLEHRDPYNEHEVLRAYQAALPAAQSEPELLRQVAIRQLYPPTAYMVLVPFALLPWKAASLAWIFLTAAGLILSGFLMCISAAESTPVLAGALIALLFANCIQLLMVGNPAGLAVSLCIIAAWCFVEERWTAAGILCMALSLAIKPQDSGLVWLYFVLAGGASRGKALQSAAVCAILSIPFVAWVWAIAPQWYQHLRANIQSFSVPGGILSPDATTALHSSPGAQLNCLQMFFGFFTSNPILYNGGAYIFCTAALLWLCIRIIRTRSSPQAHWVALAAISAFTMLPMYHRQYDAKLLLLTIPACAWIWQARKNRWIVLLLELCALILNGELFWICTRRVVAAADRSTDATFRTWIVALSMIPMPIALLALGLAFTWCLRRPEQKLSETM